MEYKTTTWLGVSAAGIITLSAGVGLCLWAFPSNDPSAAAEPVSSAATQAGRVCDGAPNGFGCGEPGSDMLCVAGACVSNLCGDNRITSDEQCDDGNASNGDGCSAQCRWEALPNCGNGVVDPAEECDDSNADDADHCTLRCTVARCGDGAKTAGELCDDGNIDDTDACTAECRPPDRERLRAFAQSVASSSERGRGSASAPNGHVAAGASAPSLPGAVGGGPLPSVRGNAGAALGGGPGAGGAAGVEGSSSALTAAAGTTEAKSRAGADGPLTGTESGPVSKHGSVSAASGMSCGECRNQKCRNFQGFDLVAGCSEAINPTYGGPPTDPFFLEQCIAVVKCAEAHNCAHVPGRDSAGCYCGSHSVDECQVKGPAPDAPCVAEWQAAARSDVNAEVLDRFSIISYPAGWAYLLLACDREYCRASCVDAS